MRTEFLLHHYHRPSDDLNLPYSSEGAERFRQVLNDAMRRDDAVERWYLSVVNEMAQQARVATVTITGLWWGELDSPEDLAEVRAHLDEGTKAEARAHRAQFTRA